MPKLKNRRLFISHAWRYDADYYRLVGLLNSSKLFRWANYSVPQHDPVEAADTRALQRALDRQIRPVQVVLIISGMYVNHRDWIQYEIDVASAYSKPIIGVRPWGAKRIPGEVQAVAVEMVGWNTSSIVAAIRRYCR